MDIVVPYNAIILGAFKCLIKFENRRNVKISDLNAYLTEALKIGVEVYNIRRKEENGYDNSSKDITIIKMKDYLNEFLEKYGSFFQLKDDELILNKEIDAQDLEQLIIKEINDNNLSDDFLISLEELNLLQKLKITKIPNLIQKIIKLEEKIEQTYMNAEYEEARCALWGLERIIFLNRLGLCSEDLINSIITLAITIQAKEEPEFFPVDFEEFKSSPYYTINTPFMGEDKVSKMCNYFNKAIFGDFSLKYEKLVLMLEDVYEYKICGQEILNHDKNSEGEEDYDEVLEATAMFNADELRFCYRFIEKIDEFIASYGENADLSKVRNRLVYVIDDPSIEIIDEEVLDEYILESDQLELDDNPLGDFANETYFLCENIFKRPYSFKTVRELLFIASYYEITLDPKVKQLIANYQSYSEYPYYFQIIFGHEPDKFLKREL